MQKIVRKSPSREALAWCHKEKSELLAQIQRYDPSGSRLSQALSDCECDGKPSVLVLQLIERVFREKACSDLKRGSLTRTLAHAKK